MPNFKTAFFLSFLIFISCSKDDDSSNPADTITNSKECFTTKINGGIVKFNSICSKGVEQWLWAFGDNSTSILENPEHEYATFGSYTVSLKITDSLGISSTSTQTVIIEEVCRTCAITTQGVVNDKNFCGTEQTAEIFCNNCNAGGFGNAFCR